MNKTELVNSIAQRTGQSSGAVTEMLDAFERVIVEQVSAGEKVTLPGFLAFDRAERAARTGRNPATGAELKIPAASVPRIKAGKGFKDAVGR